MTNISKSGIGHRMPITDNSLLIAMGVYPGMRGYGKFGTNLDVNGSYEPIWMASQLWTPLPGATTLEIASSSVLDAMGGAGATLLMVQGLDGDYVEAEEVVVLTGQTPVVTVNEYIALNRAFVVGVTGGETSNVGDLYIADDSTDWALGVPLTLAAIQVKIPIGRAWTQQAIYTVPAGHTAFVQDLYVSGAANKAFSFQFMHMDPSSGTIRISMEGELLNDTAVRRINPYAPVPEKWSIWTQAKVDTGAGACSSGYNMILVENAIYGL